ncbi:serine hydrolase domain-containing protein [Nesterenkonia flava]|uniref:Serine hydrolase domain-containing protein n=1 Tax=Nesterenkonia flava TaxID=469799 RepID=A0ABU1FUZ3_9MICC|nr:serine hydrolase domain-containing protein [Nesterenkonia flava]MDR5712484.1 serine hydrolase domain-containing protein [Nesterenkonia flava]
MSTTTAPGRGLTIAGICCLLALTACQQPETLPERGEGTREEQLQSFLEDNSREFRHSAAVAVIEDGDIHIATSGEARTDSVFEIASLSKPLTGMLLADAVDRGEVQLEDPVADLLPELSGTEVGEVSLEELATHTSGLPLVPEAEGFSDESDALRREGRNPYPIDAEELVRLAGQQQLSGRGSYLYSNFGISLLGHALAARAGIPYEDLLVERLTGPLEMEHTFASRLDGHPSDELLLPGHGVGEEETFASEAFSPSSSLRSSIADYSTFALAVLEDEAPGMSAADPSSLHPRMGLGWHLDDETTLWHNGMSHGFGTIVWIDRAEETAVVIFSNEANDLTDIGQRLLRDLD